MATDYVCLNIPALIGRKVWLRLPGEQGGPLVDEDWSVKNGNRVDALITFLLDNDLVISGVKDRTDLKNMAIRLSDLASDGRQLFESGAIDQWLGSFDRNRSKIDTDVSSLIRRLSKIRKTKNRDK